MILYHYCSNEAFLSIIQNRSIWLSSLSLSNDSMEGKWLRKVFREICEEDQLDQIHVDTIMHHFIKLEREVDCLGFCLSESRDQLSQWRGYADDGKGMCIGFSECYLNNSLAHDKSDSEITFELNKIDYNLDDQKKGLTPIYKKMKDLSIKNSLIHTVVFADEKITKTKIKRADSLRGTAHMLLNRIVNLMLPRLFMVKNPAFGEEQEWRLLSYILSDYEYLETGVSFRSTENSIKPYRTFDLVASETNPIAEVILGPKNITPLKIVESFLSQNSFKEVKVSRSDASYR